MQRFGSHRCGGSLITANRVLSAAHCTFGISIPGLAIRAGSTFSQDGGQLLSVSVINNHQSYNDDTLDNDICVLWISGSFFMNEPFLSAIRIPYQNEGVAAGALAQVAGWGALCENCPGSSVLRYISVPIVPNGECYDAFTGRITPRMICAGFFDGSQDACQGDTGGPLTISGTVVGIVSWGEGCARVGRPGVYTRVAEFSNWINALIDS